jgi:glycosyltransferase involved in cell wall biosynthesis
VTREHRRGQPLHLVEVGVRWPPETFLRWKLEGLAARGMRVTVASRQIDDASQRLRGVDLLAVPQRGGGRRRPASIAWRTFCFGLRSPRRLVRLLRGVRQMAPAYRRRYGGALGLLPLYLPLARLTPDVVHFEWEHAAALYLPLFDVWECPIVISCHGSQLTVDPHLPGGEGYAALLPGLLRSATAVHCVSQSLRRRVLELGVPAQHSRVIRQGVDTAVFRPKDGCDRRQHAPMRVIVIGWARWVKGFEWALEAIRTLVDRGVPVRLEIIGVAATDADLGDPAERRRLRHTVQDLELSDRVQLCGALATAEVAERLRDSDVLLVPSLMEGLPTVVLEAMASGVPVVATDCGGVSEAVTDGREGLLVAPRDAEALARALERLWRDPELRARMGEAGRETATSRFELDRQLREFLALYTEVART